MPLMLHCAVAKVQASIGRIAPCELEVLEVARAHAAVALEAVAVKELAAPNINGKRRVEVRDG